MNAEPPDHPARVAEAYQELHRLLFAIAYRMLGSVAEAEDVVQEAFLRFQRALSAQETAIESPKAYLSAVTTRLAIDHLRSARVRRESYIGEWLPEPLLTDGATLDAAGYVETAETVSMAFLLLLERLTPVERAVFLLHDLFDYGYDEIATILGKTPENCRQLAVRARRHVRDHRPRFEPSQQRREELATGFFEAVGRGDVEALVGMLAADAVVYGDGGGVGPSWLKPILGRDRVIRLLAGLGRQMQGLGVAMHRCEINGQPGVLFLDPSGRLTNVMTVDIADDEVQAIRSVINPDKLRHIGPVADVRALLRERGEGRHG